MPQVHSKQRLLDQDPSAFSKNSRYMASLKFRRMNALNNRDKHLTKIKVNYFDRHADMQLKKYQRARNRIIDKIQRNLAYKMVLKRHRISKAKDYKNALTANYSFHALQHEVIDMMYCIQPDVIREQKARALMDENRRRYEGHIRQYQEKCAIIFPVKKTSQAFDLRKTKAHEDCKDHDKNSEDETSVLSPLPKIDPRRGGLLSRRIIEEPESRKDSKPGSPQLSRSPAKTQGITMTMMRKQKSFMENKKSFIENQEMVSHEQNTFEEIHEHETIIVKDKPKIVENQFEGSKENKDKTITLPPIKQKGVTKFTKPNIEGITAKPRRISGTDTYLPALKIKRRLQEVNIQA